MHIGLSRPPTPKHPIPDVDAALVAEIAEELGFESIFYGEHPIRPVSDPGHAVHSAGVPFFQDLIVGLARASALTSKIKIGTGIVLVPTHNAIMLAKQLGSLDFYSGGRLIVGIGAGWSRIESEVLGGDFDRRWSQTREAVKLMKLLWSQETVEFTGEFYNVPPLQMYPQPTTKPWPPVILPGPPWYNEEPLDSPKNIKYFRRIVEYGDGWLPVMLGKEAMSRGPAIIAEGRQLLNRLCEDVAREPTEIQINVLLRTEIHDGDYSLPELVSRDTLKRYEDLGIERALITLPTVSDEASARIACEKVAEAAL